MKLNLSEGASVCGRSKVMIDSVILSAALEDVGSRGASSTGCLIVVIRLGAVLIELTQLTVQLFPSL
jgi:hypothetical protein